MEAIKGYDYGKVSLEQSPVTMQDLDLLKKTLLRSDDDSRYLKMAGEVLKEQTTDVLDVWYGYVGSNHHLIEYFAKNGVPNMEYLTAVRARFERWILDICNRPYDQTWLNYQYEIAKRHHRIKKNKTDNVEAAPIIKYRYMTAFIYPITVTIKSFLSKREHSQSDVEGMYNAWFKAITLTAVIWTYPYVNASEF
jgi:hypothetical protein